SRHHRQLHQAGNEIAWWKGLNIDALSLARQLWEQTHHNEGQTDKTTAGIESTNGYRETNCRQPTKCKKAPDRELNTASTRRGEMPSAMGSRPIRLLTSSKIRRTIAKRQRRPSAGLSATRRRYPMDSLFSLREVS
ncbi:MAG: hypothetical protein WBX35_11385, partial [Pseudolabrys sp.]